MELTRKDILALAPILELEPSPDPKQQFWFMFPGGQGQCIMPSTHIIVIAVTIELCRRFCRQNGLLLEENLDGSWSIIETQSRTGNKESSTTIRYELDRGSTPWAPIIRLYANKVIQGLVHGEA